MNDGFDGVFMALTSLNNTTMTQLLGKKVHAFGNEFHYSGQGDVEFHYESSAASNATTLTVKNSTENVVWSGAVEPLVNGEGSITWTPVDHDGNPLPEGDYTFTLEGSSTEGGDMEVNEIVVGDVDGMSFLNGVPRPSINGIEFDLSMVLRVETSDSESSDSSDQSNNDPK
jgi:flagellar basal-body rod modification protein FlgD